MRTQFLPAFLLSAVCLVACPALAKTEKPVPACSEPVRPVLFISPMGEPFRPKGDSDDPVKRWFDQADRNHDGKLTIGETVAEALKADLALETAARADLVAAVTAFEAGKDYVSRDLAASILSDAEEHIDFLETELGLIDRLGLQLYLQAQIEGKSA